MINFIGIIIAALLISIYDVYKRNKLKKEIKDIELKYIAEKVENETLKNIIDNDARVITRLRKLTVSTSSKEFYDLLVSKGIIEKSGDNEIN